MTEELPAQVLCRPLGAELSLAQHQHIRGYDEQKHGVDAENKGACKQIDYTS